MSREAMKQALEALEEYQAASSVKLFDVAVTALRAALDAPGTDYERGFVDGMQEQMKRSVDQAVRAMTGKREWVGLSNGEMIDLSNMELGRWDLILEVEAKLKEKNT